ncbi:arginase family protein [Chloroflexota bacterium]
MPEFVCIAVPHYIGQLIEGRTETDQIKASGFADEINAPWVDLNPDLDDASDPVAAVNQALVAVIQAHPDRIPIVFASDCLCALGIMKGLEPVKANPVPKPGLIWFDAHGDFNTPETTPSGFLGGMPLAMLVGRGDLSTMKTLALDPMAEEDVILTDARDLDPLESAALQASKVRVLLDVHDLLTADLPDKPLYMHLDMDIINSAELPGLAYPASDGPSTAEVDAALAHITRARPTAALLLSLWSAAITAAPVDDARALAITLRLARTFVANCGG